LFHYDGSDFIKSDFFFCREEDIGNTVVNNFKTQRWTIRKMKSTRISDDMNYYEYLPRPIIEKSQIPTVIETDLKPVLTATKVIII